MTKSLESFNFFDPCILEDPFEFYDALRRDAPVHKVHHAGLGIDLYLVSTHELVSQVMKNDQLFSSNFSHLFFGGAHPEAEAILASGWPQVDTLITSDNPQHARYRALVGKGFTPGRVSRMTAHIQQIIDDLIDEFIERGECDFIADFAVKMPIYVIGDLLGLDRDEYLRLKTWSDAFLQRLSQMQTKEQDIESAKLIVEFQRHFFAMIESRRTQSGDDLITDLVNARIEGERSLDTVEILSIVQQVSVAGNESTRNTMIGGLGMLLQAPDQMEIVRQRPDIIGNAIDEIIRLEAPTSGMWRIVRQDTELGGVKIPANAVILVRLDSANRDPKQFSDPSRLDVRRRNAATHLSFGHGVHFCIGAMLARKELTRAIPTILNRLQNLRIVAARSDLTRTASLIHRAPRKLYLAFDPGSRLAA